MRDWSIVTQSDTPSSWPTRSPSREIVNSPTQASVIVNGVKSNRTVSPLLGYMSPYFLRSSFLSTFPTLVLRKAIDEQDFFRDAIFRDHAAVGEHFQVSLDCGFADGFCARCVPNHQRHWPLAPFFVLDADDRGFSHACAMHDQVFDLQRRHPFPAGLDHILDAVGDLNVSLRRHRRDVAGMQITPSPELVRAIGIVEIALGQPRRAQHDLA